MSARLLWCLSVTLLAGCAHRRVEPAVDLRQEVLRLENAIRARDDTIRALRLELQRLKEIDLKPRRPNGPTRAGGNPG